MATKIHKKTSDKKKIRFKRKLKIRAKVKGTPERPRLCVFKSNANIFVQIIDDTNGKTLVSVSTVDKDLAKENLSANVTSAKRIGELIAKKAISKNIKKVVFDRSGYLYHGKIKVLADAAREAGLEF
jgi:large subunit ribosomal protein L18